MKKSFKISLRPRRHGGSYPPPIPGFPVNHIFYMFYRNGKFCGYLDTRRLDLRLVCTLAESECVIPVFHPQELVILED